MTYLSDISLIHEELITLIKIHNHMKEEHKQYNLRRESQEFFDPFNLLLHTMEENVMIAIDLQIEKIDAHEKGQREIIEQQDLYTKTHPLYS